MASRFVIRPSCPLGSLSSRAGQYALTMAALAYVLLPLSGVIAFLTGATTRVRFHGLQAIGVGTVWAIAAYVTSWVAPVATVVVFVLGSLLWAALIVMALLGRDVRLPGTSLLLRVAEEAGQEEGSA